MNLHCEADTLDDLLRSAYTHVLNEGHKVQSTKGNSVETMGATLVLRQPLNRVSRTETRYRYVTPLAELCWYLSGSNDGEAIVPYLRDYAKYVEDDGTVYGGYGPRIFGEGPNRQIHNAIDCLRNKPSSRRVVVQILDKADMTGPYRKDIPCTNTIQFLVREGAVHAFVSMRSNDAWLGLVHDIFAFTMIQEMVARDLGLELGAYTHFAASLHLYDDAVAEAREFVDEGYQATTSPMDPMPPGSPWAGVSQLVAAEHQARSGANPDSITLPDDAYWADLARILIAHNLGRAGATEDAARVRREITIQPISELLIRRSTRGIE